MVIHIKGTLIPWPETCHGCCSSSVCFTRDLARFWKNNFARLRQRLLSLSLKKIIHLYICLTVDTFGLLSCSLVIWRSGSKRFKFFPDPVGWKRNCTFWPLIMTKFSIVSCPKFLNFWSKSLQSSLECLAPWKHSEIMVDTDYFFDVSFKTFRPWQTRTHCCGHIGAETNVSTLARTRNICCGHKFCVRDTKKCFWFCSETFCVRSTWNVSHFAQL